jgi:hypothetical protein
MNNKEKEYEYLINDTKKLCHNAIVDIKHRNRNYYICRILVTCKYHNFEDYLDILQKTLVEIYKDSKYQMYIYNFSYEDKTIELSVAEKNLQKTSSSCIIS